MNTVWIAECWDGDRYRLTLDTLGVAASKELAQAICERHREWRGDAWENWTDDERERYSAYPPENEGGGNKYAFYVTKWEVVTAAADDTGNGEGES